MSLQVINQLTLHRLIDDGGRSQHLLILWKGRIMSTKGWIYRSDTQYKTTLFQEISSGDDNVNTAKLSIENPAKFSVSYSENNNSSAMGHLIVEIPVSVLDEMAIAWCKRRKLQGALGGPVGQEWGSPDADYE